MDYKAIADGDPNISGALEASFLSMSVETVTRERTGEYRITDLMIAAEIGEGKAHQFLDAMEAMVPPRVKSWIETNGLNINNTDVKSHINSSVYPHKAEVLAMASETVLKYPSMNRSHLAKARTMRAKGRV